MRHRRRATSTTRCHNTGDHGTVTNTQHRTGHTRTNGRRRHRQLARLRHGHTDHVRRTLAVLANHFQTHINGVHGGHLQGGTRHNRQGHTSGQRGRTLHRQQGHDRRAKTGHTHGHRHAYRGRRDSRRGPLLTGAVHRCVRQRMRRRQRYNRRRRVSNNHNLKGFRRTYRRRQRADLRYDSHGPVSRIKTSGLTGFTITRHLLRQFSNQFKHKLQISMVTFLSNRQQGRRTRRYSNHRSNRHRAGNIRAPRTQRRADPGRQYRMHGNNTNRPHRQGNNKSNRLLFKVIAGLNSRHIMKHTMRHRHGMMTSRHSRRRHTISPTHVIS